MYHLAVAFQITAILFCAIGTFLLYNRIDKAISKNLLASSVFATIFGVGYLMEMLATSEGAALYALTTQYIGLCFVALFFAIYTTELYHYFRMPNIVWVVIFIFNLATFIGVLTSGYHNFYYKERVFVNDGLFPHIETKNTLWFYFFMGVLLACMLYSAVLFILGVIKSVLKKNRVLSVIALLAGIGFMWVSFGVGFNGYEPISAIVCTVLGITTMIMMGSRNSAIINQAYEESYRNSSIGQIITTKDGRFLECNAAAEMILPILKTYRMGEKIEYDAGEGVTFNEEAGRLYIEDKCYKVTYQMLESPRKKRDDGEIVSLTDVTVLEHQRTHDELTGMYNRAAFPDKVKEIEEAKPERLNVIVADLNGLKNINDTLGHGEGDEIIMAAAKCIRDSFDESSYLFRLGGDEFAILSTADMGTFLAMIDVMKERVDKANAKRDCKISISLGTASTTADHGIDIDKMMHIADEEMYLNKKKYYEENHIERRHV